VHTGEDLLRWARSQLQIAYDIVDNPGGGLVFATQTIGQVRAALTEQDEDRWREVEQLLFEAEDAAVRRRFERTRQLVEEASEKLR
jgi:hypothetical protein